MLLSVSMGYKYRDELPCPFKNQIRAMGMLQKVKEFFFPKYFTTFKPINYKESIKILHSNGNDFMERYRNLMRINHPDLGGSPYVCMKINEAKNFLLEDRKELSQMDKGE